MNKIDFHVHLAAASAPFLEGGAATADEMIPRLDALGTEKAVLHSAGEEMPQPGSGGEGSLNDNVRAICAQHPGRFYWMCNLDPTFPTTVERRLALYRRQGAAGVGEVALNERMDSAFLSALFRGAQALCMPVALHIGAGVGAGGGVADDAGLPLLEALLKSHPALQVVAHGNAFWHEISGRAAPDAPSRTTCAAGPVLPGGRLLQLMRRHKNLYGDLSGRGGSNAILRDEAFSLAFLQEFSGQLVFGTGLHSAHDAAPPLAAWLNAQAAAGRLGRDVHRAVLGANAHRLLH